MLLKVGTARTLRGCEIAVPRSGLTNHSHQSSERKHGSVSFGPRKTR